MLDLAAPILTPAVDERSVVQTRFATTTLAMLRWHQGEDLAPVVEQAQQVLDAGEGALGPAATADQITFVGRGWTVGIAQEAALKLRESAQLWTEAYSMMEYRHGPVSISAPGPRRLGLRRAGRRLRRRHRGHRRRPDARARRRRSPTCSGCTCCASSGPAPPGWTPTSRAT